MTRADEFRNMTDEQIADYMLRWMDCESCPLFDPEDGVCIGIGSCREQLLNWLKQEKN